MGAPPPSCLDWTNLTSSRRTFHEVFVSASPDVWDSHASTQDLFGLTETLMDKTVQFNSTDILS